MDHDGPGRIWAAVATAPAGGAENAGINRIRLDGRVDARIGPEYLRLRPFLGVRQSVAEAIAANTGMAPKRGFLIVPSVESPLASAFR